MSETEKDINNVKAWVWVVENILYSTSPERRVEILTSALALAKAQRDATNANKPLRRIDTSTWNGDFETDKSFFRLASLAIQRLTRAISNENSPEKTSEFLFATHPYGSGSCKLLDYLWLPYTEIKKFRVSSPQ
jgi:hypothetical protein